MIFISFLTIYSFNHSISTKIINENVIKKKEGEFIDAIKAGFDCGLIKKIFKQKYWARIQNYVNYQQGDIVVHKNRVAYKFDFEVKVPISVVIDRTGDYLKMASSVGFGEQLQADNVSLS